VLYAAPDVIQGVAAAADKDQARLLANQAEQVLARNPWLAEHIDIQRYTIKNKQTGSHLEILASDASSSYGLTPDFVIIDELTHWKKRDMWDSLISSAAKRHNCMVVVISNAGLGKGISWQWDAREACRTSDNWYFKRQEGPVASWITPERLLEQRKLIPGKAYQRLWLNEWTMETGDALDMADIDACTVRREPVYGPLNEVEFVAGLDLGVKNDYSSLVVLGVHRQRGKIMLARVLTWKPSDYGGQVKLEDVYQACLECNATYQLAGIMFDPWQALHMAERLTAAGCNMVQWNFNSKNLSTMATNLLDVFKNRTIELYHHDGLIHDLMRLSIVERPQGFKIEARR
jgi:phage terminase large subunit-like protein